LARKVARSTIVIPPNRQRKDVSQKHINELKESILQRGLLHPPGVDPNLEEGKNVILVGECRIMAIDLIAKEGKIFRCDGEEVKPGEIPVTLVTDLQELERREAEFDENVIRAALTWQEESEALAEMHRLRVARNPQQTVVATATELVNKSTQVTRIPVTTVRGMENKIAEAVLISKHLEDPAIQKARNAREARTLVLKKEEDAMLAELAKRRIAAMGTKPDIEIRHGDCLQILPQLDEKMFDLICTDIPYGISASGGGFRARTVHHHNYEDTPLISKQLAQTILLEGFRVTKPRANIFMFCSIQIGWEWLQYLAKNVGWTPWQDPLIWWKSESEGLAPWGKSGPRRTYESIFYATKGEKGLISSPTDVFRVNRVPRHERIFAAEKPVELMRQLVECSTLPGDLVLDPCAGSGSTLVACRETRRKALGIELDENIYKTAMANVYKEGKKDDTVHQQDKAPTVASTANRSGSYDQYEESEPTIHE
jgi:DNA modification methylase